MLRIAGTVEYGANLQAIIGGKAAPVESIKIRNGMISTHNQFLYSGVWKEQYP